MKVLLKCKVPLQHNEITAHCKQASIHLCWNTIMGIMTEHGVLNLCGALKGFIYTLSGSCVTVLEHLLVLFPFCMECHSSLRKSLKECHPLIDDYKPVTHNNWDLYFYSQKERKSEMRVSGPIPRHIGAGGKRFSLLSMVSMALFSPCCSILHVCSYCLVSVSLSSLPPSSTC